MVPSENRRLKKEIKNYTDATIQTNLDYHNYPGTSYMGYEHGWIDSSFGSASGGSKKQATIQEWSPPIYS
jgi:hypothetical protein